MTVFETGHKHKCLRVIPSFAPRGAAPLRRTLANPRTVPSTPFTTQLSEGGPIARPVIESSVRRVCGSSVRRNQCGAISAVHSVARVERSQTVTCQRECFKRIVNTSAACLDCELLNLSTTLFETVYKHKSSGRPHRGQRIRR